jgi:hypothetical protein
MLELLHPFYPRQFLIIVAHWFVWIIVYKPVPFSKLGGCITITFSDDFCVYMLDNGPTEGLASKSPNAREKKSRKLLG